MADYLHLFFDLDDTVTPSRDTIDPEMAELLTSLPHSVTIVSGSHNNQMRKQIGDLPVIQLGQNCNHALCPEAGELWRDMLTEAQKDAVHEHIAKLRRAYTGPIYHEDDLIEDRGSQLSFSIYGHTAPKEEKKRVDPNFAIRRALLAEYPFEHEEVEVTIGGSTCFDYYMRGRNKGFNVRRLIGHKGWDPDACIYFGDALFPGGNDETVVGVIETRQVRDHRHTYELLRELFT